METKNLENKLKLAAKAFFFCAFVLTTTVACGEFKMKSIDRGQSGGARVTTEGTPTPFGRAETSGHRSKPR